MHIKNWSNDNIIILRLSGSFDKTGATLVRQAIFQAAAQHPAEIIVNLREVNCIDSYGLSALVMGLQHAQENRVNLCLSDLQAPVRLIFELTRFDNAFDIFVSEEDARLAVLVNINPHVFISTWGSN
jgi:anti-sigma B factor antagonist